MTMPLRASVGNADVVLSPDHAKAVATCAHMAARFIACIIYLLNATRQALERCTRYR